MSSEMESFKAKQATKALFEALRDFPLGGGRLAVEKALAEGADPNARSSGKAYGVGARPLHLAAARASGEVISALINAGAKLEAKEEGGATALHWAVKNKEHGAKAVALLAAAGAKLEAADKQGVTPLGRALAGGRDFAIAKALLEAGAGWESFAKSEPNPIHAAIERLDVAAVGFMRQNGAPLRSLDKSGRSTAMALMQAGAFKYEKSLPEKAKGDALSIFEELVSAGVHMGGEHPERGFAAASLAMIGLCEGAPKELLVKAIAAGSSMAGGQAANNHSPGPARLASWGQLERLRLGFELGLDKRWRDSKGQSLAHWAMESRSQSMFETLEGLLADGLDPNAVDGYGDSLLQTAMGHEIRPASDRLAGILLDHGADPNARVGPKRAPPLALLLRPHVFTRNPYARASGRVELMERLAKAGANVDATADGLPLLFYALEEERSALLRLGADPTAAAVLVARMAPPEDLYCLAGLQEWVGMGAKPEALLEEYPAALKRAGESGRRQMESAGAAAYLEALVLRQSMEPSGGAKAKSLSL